ncbi:MAG: hypothetical protein QOE86_4662 [Solirubrobacteraceae bacterium]|jgi:hypothetical protein|nr:hypothetical protein [Solirubrobacteraceae bacterium]
MWRWIRSWPPWLWLPVYVGSLFVIMASQKPWLAAIAAVLILAAFAEAVRIALRREPGQERPAWAVWALAGVGVFYLLCGVAALTAGWQYGIAGLFAGIVPATAVAVIVATARRGTRGDDRRPTLGLDDRSPLGSTSEHSDAEGDPVAESRARRRRAQDALRGTSTRS